MAGRRWRLDLTEEFRPLVADSTVLTLINNGEVTAESFIRRAGAVALTDAGRRAVIAAFERRMETEVTHPLFGYRISYRRVLEVQARLAGARAPGRDCRVSELLHEGRNKRGTGSGNKVPSSHTLRRDACYYPLLQLPAPGSFGGCHAQCLFGVL